MAVVTLTDPPRLATVFARSLLPGRSGRGSTLPDTTLRLPARAVDRDHLTAYQRLCGFDVSDTLPHTYPHLLGFPLQAALIGAAGFPVPLAGLVHLGNEITVHRRLTAADRLDLDVHAENLRPHAKGRLVDLVTTGSIAHEEVWTGRSTYLHRGAGDPDAAREPSRPQPPAGPPVAVIRVPADLGRRYAAVSGDVNPIHLHPLTAKAMGFPRAIAHGMWTAARTLAQLGDRTAGPATSTVWFRKPVLLPATVDLRVTTDAGGTVAALCAHDDPAREHLVLEIRSVA